MEEEMRLLKALADPTRLKLLKLILAQEMCVCQLQAVLGISQSAVSQHVGKLKAAGLVGERRSGPWTYYRADARRIMGGMAGLSAFLAADLADTPALTEERDRLQALNQAELCQSPNDRAS